jgi:hypothetical protein
MDFHAIELFIVLLDQRCIPQMVWIVLHALVKVRILFHLIYSLRKYARAEGVILPPSEELCLSGGSNSPATGAQSLTQFGEKGKNASET